ncbi:MAG: T9SS type A sorting domain-containing protein, partial [Vicingaceae bacterium]
QDVMVSDYVGINSLNGENAVNIYPNPASDVVNINVSGVAGSVLNIEVSNIAGQVILTRQLNDFNGSATTELDISDLNKGVFLVKIYTEDMITTKRLVVQK